MNPLSPTQYPALTKYAEDLTLQIAQGKLSPSINGKDNFNVQRVLQVLHRRMKNHPILVGEDSAQKLAIVHEVARLILKGELPDSLTTSVQRIFTFRHDAFFAEVQDFDILRDRLSSLVEDLKGNGGRIALFVDDLHLLVGALSERTRYIGQPFIVAHARGEVRLIGATKLEKYRQYIDTDGFFHLERKSAAILIG